MEACETKRDRVDGHKDAIIGSNQRAVVELAIQN